MPEYTFVRDQGAETLRSIARGFFPQNIRAIEVLPVNRFVGSDFALGDVGDTAIIAVTLLDSILSQQIVAASHGVRLVEADALILATNSIKSANDGKATRLATATEMVANSTGVATSFTQPGAADMLAIHQATDESADAGRSIVIVGVDANSDPLVDTIALDSGDTTNVVSGTVEFTEVVGVYTSDGEVVAADITIEEDGDGTDIATLAANTASLGVIEVNADFYDSAISFEGPNSDSTYIVVQGYKSTDTSTIAYETYTFDGASPAIATSATRWHHITRLFVGGFTNAAEADLDLVADDSSLFLGVALADAAEGDYVPVAFQPNYTAWDVQAAAIADDSITGAKFATGIFHEDIIAGQDGGSDNTYPVTGIATTDELVSVIAFQSGVPVEDTANFSITAAGIITDSGDTNYTDDTLKVLWIEK